MTAGLRPAAGGLAWRLAWMLAWLLAAVPAAAHAEAAPTPPAAPGQVAPAAPAPASPAPAPAAVPGAEAWLTRGSAQLTVLDKVSAAPTPLTVLVGGHVTFGPLTIAVRACDIRPPDRAPDATAFLDVTDSTQGAAEFHGWLIRSVPAASIFENPGYDIRLKGCA